MAKNQRPSWKKEHPVSFLSNSVEKADRSLKQAMSHPEEIAIEHAFNSISRAENAFANAVEQDEHMDIVEQNNDQLKTMRDQLRDVSDIVEDQQ